ncbi:MAG: glycosyltransferase [Micromonosporaceae bacterium]
MNQPIDVYFLSYDGISSLTCGVGTGSRNVARCMPRVANLLSDRYDCRFHVVTPHYSASMDGYDGDLLDRTREIVATVGGQVLFHPDGTDGSTQFGDVDQWRASSAGAAMVVLEQVRKAGVPALVLATDTPYAGVGECLTRGLDDPSVSIGTVWTAHSTIRNHPLPDAGGVRYQWERAGVTATADPRCLVGTINRFMRDHLIAEYGAEPDRMVPFANGLPLHEDLGPVEDATELMRRLGIDEKRRYVMSCGRAERYKGFLELIRAFHTSQDDHDLDLLLILSDLTKQDPILDECSALVDAMGVRATIVRDFLSHPSLRALVGHPSIRVFAGSSLADSGTILPAEMRWWSEDIGPVIVLSDVDASKEAVRHGVDGYLADIHDPRDFGGAITAAVRLTDGERRTMLKAGRQFLFAEFDYASNIATCIASALDKFSAGVESF